MRPKSDSQKGKSSSPGLFDRWAPRLLLFFLGTIPLALCLDMQDTYDLPKLVLLYAVDLVMVALWIRQSMTQGFLRFRRTTLDIPLLLFLMVAGFSTAFSIEPSLSFWGAYKIYVFGWMPMA